MVRKQVFSRDDVVQAGFRVVDADGLEQLSARKVADALGSSTAPVYSNFANMGELTDAVANEALRRFMEETRNPRSEDPFLNIGLGVLEFAWRHPRWYAALFRETDLGTTHEREMLHGMMDVMTSIPLLSELSEIERVIILRKMAIFTHGMATEICTGRADPEHRDVMRVLLEEVGGAVVEDALTRGPRSESEIAVLGSLENCHSRSGKGEGEGTDENQ